MNALERLPWRGPGEDRPQLAVPPARMPLRDGGSFRKRWRYVAAFAEPFHLCAARVEVGPLGQTFWAIVDRETGQLYERTRMRLPAARGEVFREQRGEDVVDRVSSGEVRADLRFDAGQWVEAICPSGSGSYVWTRKRCDVPVRADIRVAGKRWQLDARGVEDESAGYHPRHTVWSWSAGIGRARDGRSVGWNLVAGVNDPPQRSERAIWLDGEPSEPGPVSFDDLDAVEFEDGSRLAFTAEQERYRRERKPFVRYEYRQPFGVFAGSLPGGVELESGLGVMEHHDAYW